MISAELRRRVTNMELMRNGFLSIFNIYKQLQDDPFEVIMEHKGGKRENNRSNERNKKTRKKS